MQPGTYTEPELRAQLRSMGAGSIRLSSNLDREQYLTLPDHGTWVIQPLVTGAYAVTAYGDESNQESESEPAAAPAPLSFPRLPELAPASEPETAQAYGLRALLFVVGTGVTATVPTSALELADHVFPIAISGAELAPETAERLAASRRLITAALRGRAAAEPLTAPRSEPAGVDRPNIGPGAVLAPRPIVEPPNAGAERPELAPAVAPALLRASRPAAAPLGRDSFGF